MTHVLVTFLVLSQATPADAPVVAPSVAPVGSIQDGSTSLAARTQLRSARRMLMQDRPSFIPPGLVAFLGAGVLVIGCALAAYGIVGPLQSGYYGAFGEKESVESVGGVIAGVGLVAVIAGIVWLSRALARRGSIDAQVEEIDGRLLDLGAQLPALQ